MDEDLEDELRQQHPYEQRENENPLAIQDPDAT